MPISNQLRNFIIIVLVAFNFYAITQAVAYDNPIGILLSVCSVIALICCVYLFRKLKEVEAEDERLLH